MHAEYDVSIPQGSTIMDKFKVFATDRHTERHRQDKNDMPEFHSGAYRRKQTQAIKKT